MAEVSIQVESQKPDKTVVGVPGTWSGRSIAGDLMQLTISPQQVRSYLLSAAGGDISAQSELFEKMEENDGELDAHLRTRKAGVASLPWEIQPADDSPEAARSADFCKQVLEEKLGDVQAVQGITGIDQAVMDLLDAVPKGFSALEIEWETSAKMWAPTALHWRPQRWFRVGANGQEIRLRDTAAMGGIPLNRLNWIIHRCQARSGFLHRTGLLRSCTRAFIVRHYGWKDWLGFAEVFGMPLRIGYLREGIPWDSDEAKQLWAAVRAIGMDFAAVMREGNRMEFPDVSRTGGTTVFERLLEAASRELTLAILGQPLTSGGEQGGSYALGKVQNIVRMDLVETDARALNSTLTQQLLRPIVRLNLGPKAPVPRWHIAVEEPENLVQLADVVDRMADRLDIGEGWARKKFGFPELEPGEKPLRPKPAGGGMFSNAAMAQRANSAPRLHQVDRHLRIFPKLGLQWLGERRIATPEAWETLSPAGKQRVWYVTGLDGDRISDVARLFVQAMRDGRPPNWLLGELEKRGISVTGAEAAGANQIDAWHARLVYANNAAETYAADRWIKARETIQERPYGEWLLGPGPCPLCEPLGGKIAPLDGNFFSLHWPPLHHGCECEVVTASRDEIEGEPDDSIPLASAELWRFDRGDSYYLESRGQGPRTDAGRADLEILKGLSRLS